MVGWWELSLSTHSIGTHLKNGNTAIPVSVQVPATLYLLSQNNEKNNLNKITQGKQSDGFLDSATSLSFIH
jgi:hypothetical protein